MGISPSEIDPYDEQGIAAFGEHGWGIVRRLLRHNASWAKELQSGRLANLLTPETLDLLDALLEAGFGCRPTRAVDDNSTIVSRVGRDGVQLVVRGGKNPGLAEVPRPEEPETVWTLLAASGIGIPRLPQDLHRHGHWVGPTKDRWSTISDQADQPDAMSDYMMADEGYLLGPVPDHLTTTSDGRAFTVRAARGTVAVQAQELYGHEGTGPAVQAGLITTMVRRVGDLLNAEEGARWSATPRGRDVAIRWSSFRGISELWVWDDRLRRWDLEPFNARQYGDIFEQAVANIQRHARG